MADTQRTYTELLTSLFQDGQAPLSITAQDIRDFIVSVASGNQEILTPAYKELLPLGVSFTRLSGGASPGHETFRDGIIAHAFDGTGGLEEGFFELQIPHDYKASTELTFNVHWANNVVSPVGNVKWQIEYTIAAGDNIFGASTILSVVQAVTAQYTHTITNDIDMTISGSNPELIPDAMLLGRIFRDSADIEDTFENDAFLFNVDAHYQLGRVGGTAERSRPYTLEGF